MPVVTVHMWPGRAPEVKAKIIKAITDSLTEAAGIPAEATQVILVEVPKENWGSARVPASQTAAAPAR